MQADEVDEPNAVSAADMVEYVPLEPTERHPDGGVVLLTLLRRFSFAGAPSTVVPRHRAEMKKVQGFIWVYAKRCVMFDSLAQERGFI